MKRTTRSYKKKNVGSYPFTSVVLSVSFSLFLVGLFALMFVSGKEHTQKLKEFKLNIYLTSNSGTKDVEKLKTLLANKPYVLKKNQYAAISFASKEDITKRFAEENQLSLDEIVNTAGFNPFKACITATISANFTSQKKLIKIKKELENYSSVHEVDLNNTDTKKIAELDENLNIITIILTVLIIASIIIILFLINNTIKLALFSQRFLIRSMQLVGATASFIQKPFVGRSLAVGIVSGLIATGLLYVTSMYFNHQLPILKTYLNLENILIIGASLIIIGCIVTAFSTIISVQKYLKTSLDELH